MPDDERLTTRDLVGGTAVEDDVRTRDHDGGTASVDERPLLPEDQTTSFQDRWAQIQTRFVDEPQQAVQDADALVAELMRRLAETFADERSGLEQQWSSGGDVDTEQLRIALQRYRAFFQRLLST
jgi:hypothetical protein